MSGAAVPGIAGAVRGSGRSESIGGITDGGTSFAAVPRRTRTAVLLGSVLALGLAACGGSETPDGSATTGAPVPTTATTTEATTTTEPVLAIPAELQPGFHRTRTLPDGQRMREQLAFSGTTLYMRGEDGGGTALTVVRVGNGEIEIDGMPPDERPCDLADFRPKGTLRYRFVGRRLRIADPGLCTKGLPLEISGTWIPGLLRS